MDYPRFGTGRVLFAAITVMAIWSSIASGQAQAPVGPKIKIAVLGDSISTQPHWPDRLGKLLGEGYEVKAFAANGTGIIRSNIRSIWRRYEMAHACQWQPNVMILMYDHAASRKGEWNEKAFLADYKELIARLQTKVASKPKLYICLPIPAMDECYFGIVADTLNNHVVPAVRKVAEETAVPLIDTHTPIKGKADMIGMDGVFPTERGYATIAVTVYKALTGKDAPPQPEILAAVPVVKTATPAEQAVEGWKDKPAAAKAELTAAIVLDPKGDGPDAKPNTDDDAWGFWFMLADPTHRYNRLDLPTWTMPDDQRKNGIRDPNSPAGHQGKVTGPIASSLPDLIDSEGWIFHTDWDGRYEGIWGNKRANCVLMHPYVEKNGHHAVAVTYTVPASGVYTLSGKVTDLQVVNNYVKCDGITWKIEIAEGGETGVLLGKGQAGDGHGRPDSTEFKIEKVKIGGGKNIRLVIHPNFWWGTDLTRIDSFKIERQ
ncbi:MAG: GDSL-type esterase/lipase family protein [Planctomycetaceae bacterium]|nr:GDSL-type esterase/lipase family protein [Planctomycetaceae bacterium]